MENENDATAPKAAKKMKPLVSEPLLLPGEDRGAYDQLLADLTEAVQPSDRLEELWVSEAVAKHWEVLRQRRHKRGFIGARRQAGLQNVLQPLKSYGVTEDGMELAGALAWKYIMGDPAAVREVEELFKKAHLSAEAVEGATMALHIDTLATMDQLIWYAEKRRDASLREIEHHRAPFGRALRRAITSADEDNVRAITPAAEQKKAA